MTDRRSRPRTFNELHPGLEVVSSEDAALYQMWPGSGTEHEKEAVIEHHEIEPRISSQPGSNTPHASEPTATDRQPKRRRRKLAIIVTVATVVAIGLVVGIVMGVRASLGHGSSSNDESSSNGTHCVGGTILPGVSGNYLGLCQFTCSYDYCPPDQCQCTSFARSPQPTPAVTGQKGCPLSTEDNSYLGLCSFSCNHGYCPPTACSSNC